MTTSVARGQGMRRALLIGSLAVNVLLVSFIGVLIYKKHAWKAAMAMTMKSA